MNKELTITGGKLDKTKLISQWEKAAANADVTLLVRAHQLNKLSEVSQVALGMVLAEIKRTEAFRPEYEDFSAYYKTELRRSKGDVSKLLKVGDFMLSNGFPEETQVPYTLLYTSMSVFPDKEPEYILAAAQTNSLSEIMENRRDDAFGSDHNHVYDAELYLKCSECGKFDRQWK